MDSAFLVELVILFLASWLAATVSGAAGFGGALILLPILTNLLGVKAAVPVLTIAQLGGQPRVIIRWKDRERQYQENTIKVDIYIIHTKDKHNEGVQNEKLIKQDK